MIDEQKTPAGGDLKPHPPARRSRPLRNEVRSHSSPCCSISFSDDAGDCQIRPSTPEGSRQLHVKAAADSATSSAFPTGTKTPAGTVTPGDVLRPSSRGGGRMAQAPDLIAEQLRPASRRRRALLGGISLTSNPSEKFRHHRAAAVELTAAVHQKSGKPSDLLAGPGEHRALRFALESQPVDLPPPLQLPDMCASTTSKPAAPGRLR